MIKTEKFTSARWYYLNDERCLDFMFSTNVLFLLQDLTLHGAALHDFL